MLNRKWVGPEPELEKEYKEKRSLMENVIAKIEKDAGVPHITQAERFTIDLAINDIRNLQEQLNAKKFPYPIIHYHLCKQDNTWKMTLNCPVKIVSVSLKFTNSSRYPEEICERTGNPGCNGSAVEWYHRRKYAQYIGSHILYKEWYMPDPEFMSRDTLIDNINRMLIFEKHNSLEDEFATYSLPYFERDRNNFKNFLAREEQVLLKIKEILPKLETCYKYIDELNANPRYLHNGIHWSERFPKIVNERTEKLPIYPEPRVVAKWVRPEDIRGCVTIPTNYPYKKELEELFERNKNKSSEDDMSFLDGHACI